MSNVNDKNTGVKLISKVLVYGKKWCLSNDSKASTEVDERIKYGSSFQSLDAWYIKVNKGSEIW